MCSSNFEMRAEASDQSLTYVPGKVLDSVVNSLRTTWPRALHSVRLVGRERTVDGVDENQDR